jgi:hypothetical protein
MEAARATIQITSPEVEALINRLLKTGAFKDAEEVILHALKSSEGKGGESMKSAGKQLSGSGLSGKRTGFRSAE